MTPLSDSSEIREAARLAAQLLKPLTGAPLAGSAAHPPPPPASETVAPAEKASASSREPIAPTEETVAAPSEPSTPPPAVVPTGEFRQDRLEFCLASMCQRGGITGAVVADDKGLPLIVHNSPVGADVLAAFTTVLGGALEKAGTILGEHGAETISMDINYSEKIVLHRFNIGANACYMMVLCPQEVEERSEIELSIEQIIAILTDAN